MTGRLGEEDLRRLRELRHSLHQTPELSSQEAATAQRIQHFLTEHTRPTHLHTNLAGHGLIAVYDSGKPGKTVALRCELDALPIQEDTDIPHQSHTSGVSHKCGHDGHMAILCGVALAMDSLETGRVALTFQPAEETGEGGPSMVEEQVMRDLNPDFIFALHNIPGHELGQVSVREGTFCCGSVGVEIKLTGRTSHSAYPEEALNPMREMQKLLMALPLLANAQNTSLVTIAHASLGAPSYGITPGAATIHAVLRSDDQANLERMQAECLAVVEQGAKAEGLTASVEFHEYFPVTVNNPIATEIVRKALPQAHEMIEPFRWSEDFAHFAARYPCAMFGLGAGLDCPPLHSPDYDFPDELIQTGVEAFLSIVAASA